MLNDFHEAIYKPHIANASLASIEINDAIISFEKGQAIDTTIHLLFIYFSIILQKTYSEQM